LFLAINFWLLAGQIAGGIAPILVVTVSTEEIRFAESGWRAQVIRNRK
jgi:hypothetical protein